MPNFFKKKIGSFKTIEKEEDKCVKKMSDWSHGPTYCCQNVSKTSFHSSCKARTYKNCIQKLHTQNWTPPSIQALKMNEPRKLESS